jgi:hypothetical protein
MNQRHEPRFDADQWVSVTLFGEPDIRLQARIKNVSGRGIGLEFQCPVAIGTALKIVLDDAMLLGEVVYCRKEETSFYVGVELGQALCGLVELGQMLRAFSPEPSGPHPAYAMNERSHQDQQ